MFIMAKQERAFKGVWIPAEIWLDKNLSVTEKCIYAEISSFCNTYQSCYASNKHFANFAQISENRASHIISGLIDKGYIKRTLVYKEDGKTLEKRLLQITMGYCYSQQGGVVTNNNTPIVTNNKENNTVINNTLNNTSDNILSGKPDHADETVEKIISHLNDRAGTRYKCSTRKTRSLISARLNEGFSLDDFISVIDKKCCDWGNDAKMSKYLRPETLFGTKFEGYLNEREKTNGNIQRTYRESQQKSQGNADAEWDEQLQNWCARQKSEPRPWDV
jgi:uncharacterized phage protein (TIGR02220 family)